jgi:uncharacterized protein YutE (UPF0331/DUF86 family)
LNRDQLTKCIDAIEESYEFFLAFAAQGVSGDEASRSEAQLRELLERTDGALTSLVDHLPALIEHEKLEPPETYHAAIEVVRRDAGFARAAVRLVLAQPRISSQLIDNLNASVHVRALLTDLFLLDEVV